MCQRHWCVEWIGVLETYRCSRNYRVTSCGFNIYLALASTNSLNIREQKKIAIRMLRHRRCNEISEHKNRCYNVPVYGTILSIENVSMY